MANMNNTGVICIVKKKEFLASMPDGWGIEQGKMKNFDNEFTVMVQNDKFFEGRDTYYEMDSIEELEFAKDLFRSRPIFTTAKCRKPYDDAGGPESSVSWLEDEYVVMVNTANTEIASQFERAFNLAHNFLRQGKTFRVSICLSESLKAYYNANVHAHGESNEQTLVTGCDIHLTHGAKAPNCADQCFACKTAPQIAMWVTCFPIYLLTGAPYRFYKTCIKGLKDEKIKQIVPVTLFQGPFQTGYQPVSFLFLQPINSQPNRY